MFEAVYMATKVPFREILKPKPSGRAEDDAVFEVSSSTVTVGCAYGEGLVRLEAGGPSSSLMAEVRAVEWADASDEKVSPADEAERCVFTWSSADVASELSDAVEMLVRASPSASLAATWLLTGFFPLTSVLIAR